MDSRTKKCIIIADDNKLIAKVLSNKLTFAGYAPNASSKDIKVAATQAPTPPQQ